MSTLGPAKTVESIEMLLGVWTLGEPKKPSSMFIWGSESLQVNGQFGGKGAEASCYSITVRATCSYIMEDFAISLIKNQQYESVSKGHDE